MPKSKNYKKATLYRSKYADNAATAMAADPASLAIDPDAPLVVGIFPVADLPRYQAPISVSWPLPVKNAALGPTLDTEERKAPK